MPRDAAITGRQVSQITPKAAAESHAAVPQVKLDVRRVGAFLEGRSHTCARTRSVCRLFMTEKTRCFPTTTV
eukprot:scaffold90964_cov30-Tisochrysis_lutea.AAC.2